MLWEKDYKKIDFHLQENKLVQKQRLTSINLEEIFLSVLKKNLMKDKVAI
jgi:hypothetical protein